MGTTAFFYDKQRSQVKGRERLIEEHGVGSFVGAQCTLFERGFRYFCAKVLQLVSLGAPVQAAYLEL